MDQGKPPNDWKDAMIRNCILPGFSVTAILDAVKIILAPTLDKE
jgi:hypothetical protein